MEIRVRDDSVEITGYVNAVGRKSEPLRDVEGYFTETIQPGAFGRSLAENPNIPMLLNHDESRVLARDDALDLREDNVGLHVRATVTDPEVMDKAREGRLRGWSFGFIPTQQSMGQPENSMRHRDVYGMQLTEVSLLDDTRKPAYPATSVYTRDGDETVEYRSMDDWTIDINIDVIAGDQPVETPELPPKVEPLELPE